MKNASGFKAAHLRYPRVQMGQKPYIFHEYAAKRVELSRSGDNSKFKCTRCIWAHKTNLAVVLVVRYIEVDK